MTVLTLGLNHHTAAVDLRGRFAFAVDQLAPALKHLHERLTGSPQSAQPEVALLSTCNRTELYCAAGGVGAARHAFRVASGLDSMVLGEPQILGQMKQAVREADTAGTLGTTLHQLFQRSFAVAKEVRTSTAI